MNKPDKPKTKAQRMKEFAAAAIEHLIELSKEHEYPLTRPNWTGISGEMERQLTPHFPVAEELARIDAAKKRGVDLDAMEQRIIAWRAQHDLVTPEEIMERFGLLHDEVIQGQDLGFLNFVPIPDDVVQVPDRYRTKNDHWNYPRAEMEALTSDKRRRMSEGASMTIGKAADYLKITFQDMRNVLEMHSDRIKPCGYVQSPVAYGKPLYRIIDIRRIELYLKDKEPERLEEMREERKRVDARTNK